MNKNTVIKELNNRLANMKGQCIDLTMKVDGATVCVEPSYRGRYEVWFSAYHQIACVNTVDEVAEILINYPAKAIELADAENAWVRENEPIVRAYFKEHFEGKSWDEINNDEDLRKCWSYYSDYHKDVFGYRPHGVVCGVLI